MCVGACVTCVRACVCVRVCACVRACVLLVVVCFLLLGFVLLVLFYFCFVSCFVSFVVVYGGGGGGVRGEGYRGIPMRVTFGRSSLGQQRHVVYFCRYTQSLLNSCSNC